MEESIRSVTGMRRWENRDEGGPEDKDIF